MEDKKKSPLPPRQTTSEKSAPKLDAGEDSVGDATRQKSAGEDSMSSDYFAEYDDYDDFDLKGGGGGGGGGCGGGGSRVQKRKENRGGGAGSGSIYSAKHTRIRESRKKGQGSK